jgi:hypothetical protein
MCNQTLSGACFRDWLPSHLSLSLSLSVSLSRNTLNGTLMTGKLITILHFVSKKMVIGKAQHFITKRRPYGFLNQILNPHHLQIMSMLILMLIYQILVPLLSLLNIFNYFI